MNTRQPHHHPDGSDDLDTLLGAAYTGLVTDLTAALDLDAGAAQATHPATYSALTNDLAQHLDLDAGLAAIVTGGSPPPPHDQPHQPASPPQATDQTQDLEHLRFLDAPTRLALRAAPAFHSLRNALELIELIDRTRAHTEQNKRAPTRDIDRALDIARALERDLDITLDHDLDIDRTRARALAVAVAHDLNHDLNHAHAHAYDLNRTLYRARDRARALALDLDLDLDRTLDIARALDIARGIARTLDRTLDRTRTRTRTLASTLASTLALDIALASTLALDRARTLALDIARTLALDIAREGTIGFDRASALPISDAFQLALTVALGLTYHAASGYGRILGLRLDLGQGDRLDQSAVTRARLALAEVGDDFVGADLRSAQMHPGLVGLNLVGVRWSNDTQWPSKWVDYVRGASDEIEHGLFQITRTDGKRSSTYAAT
jgi:hypothetical protein